MNIWGTQITLSPPQAQESLWKMGPKDGKSKGDDYYKETVFSGHSREVATMN